MAVIYKELIKINKKNIVSPIYVNKEHEKSITSEEIGGKQLASLSANPVVGAALGVLHVI